jgi:hypothetical protein
LPKVLLQPPSPPATRIDIASLLHPFSVIAISLKIALHSQKKLTNIQDIVKKVHHDKMLKRMQI